MISNSVRLVGSTLSDPFLCLAAGINGLAGQTGHNLEEVLNFLNKIEDNGHGNVSDEELKKFLQEHLKRDRIPGLGHDLLKKTDPRYLLQREFALKHLPDFSRFKLVSQLAEIVPEILVESGETKNLWPNADLLSGTLLQVSRIRQKTLFNFRLN